MSQTIFDALLALHAVFALAWRGALFAGLSPTLMLYKPITTNKVATLKRGITLRAVIAATGGLAVLFGLILFYYISSVDTAFAPSSTGLPIIAAGALLGLAAFALSMIQSGRLRGAFKARIAESVPGRVDTGSQRLPSKGLVISTPIILSIALILMVAGSMM